MAGGDLTNLDQSQFLAYVDGRQEVVAEHLRNLKTGLQDKRTVLVGHNVFMDLMYFYKCFFGTLPDRVEDFQRVIHELFPLVVDTKYLATHNRENPAMANSSLEQLDVDLARLPFDKVPAVGRSFHSLVLYRNCLLTVYLRTPPRPLELFPCHTCPRSRIRQLPNR